MNNDWMRKKELYGEELDERIRLINDMKYIAGIVKRGTGLELKQDVPITKQLLDYVKSLEKKAKAYDDSLKAWKEG